MADTITEVPSTVDVESNPQTTNNEPSITTNDNDTNKATDHSNSDEIRSVREIAKTTHIDFTTVGDDNGEEDYDDNEDDDYDEPPAQNINPLNHAQDDMEMETIRNSYKNSESDFTSIDSEEGSLSSPSSSKRVTMFQTGPLPDDFLLSATLAIRTSILAGDSKRRFLDESDFQSTRKYRISMAGDKKSEIKDFAPVVFSHIRKLYGISMQSYLMSWSDDKLIKKKATGKSDALFVHSPDGKYILKTIPKAEASRLRKILMVYYQHLESCPDSLMSKIFGLHRVTRRRGMPKIYFAIFNNVFDAPNSVNEIFDLKGSSVGRKACAGERVMKDLDLGDRQRIHLAPKAKTQILEQIAADCKFLAKHELMDYSLLVGIRRVSDKEPSELNTSRSQPLDQRLPGLLFFLESTKSVEVQQKKQTRVPSFRRKSMTLGKPIFASMDDLRNEIDEIDISQNTAFNMGLSNYHESPELSNTPDLISDVSSPEEKDQQDAQDDNATTTHLSQLRKIAVSTPNLIGPGRQGSLPVQSRSVPALKGVLKRGASESCRLVTSSSTPNMNTRQDANGIYINEPPMRIPFYQQDDGGLRSSKQKEEEGNAEFYEIYHFGIIDFLQKYNKKKKFANFAKSLKYEKEALSTVDPTFYMNRFLKMAEKVVGTNT